jgi:hypothetical protein
VVNAHVPVRSYRAVAFDSAAVTQQLCTVAAAAAVPAHLHAGTLRAPALLAACAALLIAGGAGAAGFRVLMGFRVLGAAGRGWGWGCGWEESGRGDGGSRAQRQGAGALPVDPVARSSSGPSHGCDESSPAQHSTARRHAAPLLRRLRRVRCARRPPAGRLRGGRPPQQQTGGTNLRIKPGERGDWVGDWRGGDWRGGDPDSLRRARTLCDSSAPRPCRAARRGAGCGSARCWLEVRRCRLPPRALSPSGWGALLTHVIGRLLLLFSAACLQD